METDQWQEISQKCLNKKLKPVFLSLKIYGSLYELMRIGGEWVSVLLLQKKNKTNTHTHTHTHISFTFWGLIQIWGISGIMPSYARPNSYLQVTLLY